MRQARDTAGYIVWIAAAFFGTMTATVLIAFEPTYHALCGTYGDRNCVGGLVYDFQTLIGSFLAVGAAAITVGQMRASDREQRRRHDEMMEAERAGERRLLEQLNGRALDQFLDALHLLKENLVPLNMARHNWRSAHAVHLVSVFYGLKSVRDLLQDERIAGCAHLFDRKTSDAYRQCLYWLPELRTLSPAEVGHHQGVLPEWLTERYMTVAGELTREASAFLEAVAKFVGHRFP